MQLHHSLLYHFRDGTIHSLSVKVCKYVSISCNSKYVLRGVVVCRGWGYSSSLCPGETFCLGREPGHTMVMKECREGQNTGHDNAPYRDSEEGEWLKGFLVSEMQQGMIKATACSIEVGRATLGSYDLGSNHWCVLVSV